MTMSPSAHRALELNPSTAVLLLHLQNDVVDPRGIVGRQGIGGVVAKLDIIGSAAHLRRAADRDGARVVHVMFARNGAGSCTSTAPALRRGAEMGFAPDSWGTQAVAELVAPRDQRVVHDTMSAFSGTELAETLFGSAVTDVVLSGVSTHLVVTATAFAASDLGLRVTIAVDCCAAPTQATHEAALSPNPPVRLR